MEKNISEIGDSLAPKKIKKQYIKKFQRWGEKGKHPLYKTWQSVLHRCNDKNEPYHGKLGIVVCDRWKNSFWDFVEDVGEKPGPEYCLDRYPNKYGHYEPGNVRWATRSEQQNNRRDNRFITARGKTQTVSQWANKLNVINYVIWWRLRNGWSDEKAIETPFNVKYTLRKDVTMELNASYMQFAKKQEPLEKDFEQILCDNLEDLLVRT